MTDSSVLTVRGLQHAYHTKPVLSIGELILTQGDIVLLSGDNGSGKSTLLRILANIIKPQRCDFFNFCGRTEAAPPAAVYLHQTPYLFNASVRANVQYGLRCCGMPLTRADEAMQWAGITHLAEVSSGQISGGEQRRVALARVRALRPTLYLLDEPLAHLDGDGRQRMNALLESLQQENATAIISSHYHNLPATQVWQLANGDISLKND